MIRNSPCSVGQPRLGDAMHQALGAEPVLHQVGDRHEGQAEALRDAAELRLPRHGAVGIQDLADDAGRQQAGQPRQVHAGLGLPHALQHATGAGAQRKDVTGAAKVGRLGVGVQRHLDGRGAVGRRNARGDTEAAVGVDAHGERGPHVLGIPLGHLGQAELVAALRGEGEADEPAPVLRHEIDDLGRDELGRADEVAFVFAVGVVRHDDDLPVAEVLDGLVDRSEFSHESRVTSREMYFPSRSPST